MIKTIEEVFRAGKHGDEVRLNCRIWNVDVDDPGEFACRLELGDSTSARQLHARASCFQAGGDEVHQKAKALLKGQARTIAGTLVVDAFGTFVNVLDIQPCRHDLVAGIPTTKPRGGWVYRKST